MFSLLIPYLTHISPPIIDGVKSLDDSGIVSFATDSALGVSLAHICGIPSPKATLAASGEANETATLGLNL